MTLPSGWYIDEHDPRKERFWNGGAWTEQRGVRHGTPLARQAPGQTIDDRQSDEGDMDEMTVATFNAASKVHRAGTTLLVVTYVIAVLGGIAVIVYVADALSADDKTVPLTAAASLLLGTLLTVAFFSAVGLAVQAYGLDLQRRLTDVDD